MNTFDLERFRDTVPYIHAHRGRCFVLCLDSAALESAGADALVTDIAQLHALGTQVVLVFGARGRIDRMLPSSKFHQGRRITRADDMSIVSAAVGATYAEIQARLSCGLVNTPMAGMQLRVLGGNLVTARPRGIHDGVDYERTGEVRRVAVEVIEGLLSQNAMVLIPPLGYSPTGEAFNLDAIALAGTVAQSIAADKLIYLHGESNLRTRRGLIRHITLADTMALKRRRRLSPTWQRLLQGAIDANLSGVRRIHLLDARKDGVLPQELFTREGSGMMLTREEPYAPRQAESSDIGGMLSLIEPLIEQGVLVARTKEEMERNIHHYRVVEVEGLIVACACLHALDETHAEMVCLAVHPAHRDQGFGIALLEDIGAQASARGIRQLYVLTTRATHWFRGHGFQPSSPRSLPVARRQFYNNHRNAQVLVKELDAPHG